ncbi:hypothetical protein [Bradyrhizobium sp. SYSU BS000235]|uniref:hypothetical protein n=1 Tax=Bradyrhizobium sp. SYSU BS000235 TaxID=3411332 RepID=UPI003C70C8C8
MLPGIRFIFVTVILSASVLIFGLSAAALLRASHEEFATLPSWRVAQPQFPSAPVETTTPTLAMLRIETPEAIQPDVTEESPAPAPGSLDADLKAQDVAKAQDVSAKPNVTTQPPPQLEETPASAEKSADSGSQPVPVPPDVPAPTAVAAAPTPTIEKQENGATDPTDSGSTNSAPAASEAQADPTKAVETKSDGAEATSTKVAEVKAPEPQVSENKSPEIDIPDVIVTAAITAEVNGHEIKLKTVKVHATKSKTVARKKTRSSIYAVAQRRRAAARARAIARAEAARIAQQKFVAVDPFTALFGIPAQPSQVVQTTPHQ